MVEKIVGILLKIVAESRRLMLRRLELCSKRGAREYKMIEIRLKFDDRQLY
jgi:hypothetical protein